ncbi:MAG: hypothetical protein Q9195_007234 [Heterodermia aff. obscurata]
MKLFLMDAVENNDTDAIGENISEVPKFAEELIYQAVHSPSCQLLELLLDTCPSFPMKHVGLIKQAMEANNVKAARILFERGAFLRDYESFSLTENPVDFIQLILQYNSNRRDTALWTLAKLMPSTHVPDLDAKIIECLHLLQPWTFDKIKMLDSFVVNAQRCCSIDIARFLLQKGVDVNTRGHSEASHASTALYIASKNRGQRAAELMRFLLESGADPSLNIRNGIAIADRPGPKNIEKWLGISWDQLVQESAKIYSASLPSANEKEKSVQEDDNVESDGDSNKDNASPMGFTLSEPGRDGEFDDEDNPILERFMASEDWTESELDGDGDITQIDKKDSPIYEDLTALESDIELNV